MSRSNLFSITISSIASVVEKRDFVAYKYDERKLF